MAGRIVLHLGLHGAGAERIERTLHASREELWPVMALGLPWRMAPVAEAVAAHLAGGTDTAPIEDAMAAWVEDTPLPAGRKAIVSDTRLLGPPPEPGDDPARLGPVVMALLNGILRHHDDPDVAVLLTVRDAGWGEALLAERDVPSRARFIAEMAEWQEGAIRTVTQAAHPFETIVAPVERYAGWRLGPAAALIDAIGIGNARRARLTSG